jgi:hypothetical protein
LIWLFGAIRLRCAGRKPRIASDPATILALRRDLLIDKAPRISDGAKGAEALDHPLTSLDRRAESLRSRLEVFGKKIRLKILGAFGDFALAIAEHFFAIFPEKEMLESEPRAVDAVVPPLSTPRSSAGLVQPVD